MVGCWLIQLLASVFLCGYLECLVACLANLLARSCADSQSVQLQGRTCADIQCLLRELGEGFKCRGQLCSQASSVAFHSMTLRGGKTVLILDGQQYLVERWPFQLLGGNLGFG